MRETPKYLIVANHIKQQIISGEFEVDEQLPQEMVLTSAFNVSRITVRKALDALEADGLIYRIQGSGTFVKANTVVKPSSTEIAVNLFDLSQLEVVDSHITVLQPEFDDIKRLNMPAKTVAYMLDRVFVHTTNAQRQVYQEILLPLQFIQGISMQPSQASIYDFLVNDIGITLASTQREYQVVTAPKKAVQALKISADTAMLEIIQTISSDSGDIILLSKNWINPKAEAFRADLRLA